LKANLSVKEQKFLEAYIQTGNISQSAKIAGSKGKDTFSLYNSGRAIIERCGITLQEIQDALGITDSYLTERLKNGLDAKKKYFGSWQGDIVESEEFEDIPTQLKALEIAHRLRGQFIDKHELTGRDGGDIILQVSSGGKKGSKNLDID
jgi:hypothetical protein